jgi:hypothetical protein
VSEIDVFRLAEKAEILITECAFVDCQVTDLAWFASLVLEEAAKACEDVQHGCNALGCAEVIRSMKPWQP